MLPPATAQRLTSPHVRRRPRGFQLPLWPFEVTFGSLSRRLRHLTHHWEHSPAAAENSTRIAKRRRLMQAYHRHKYAHSKTDSFSGPDIAYNLKISQSDLLVSSIDF
ncbi:hypothetical protein Maq22A_c28730 [Methylobacterium aquaticum]|uniref:Uncharacterized protein n=1 Tax=Methylobacterium aquaticum TaxID=270351 RepID=A0A1Y0ZCC1_9HYPH|nr:hypothetical protein Maq22A_c28730 [Methylobacterium aquaticum]